MNRNFDQRKVEMCVLRTIVICPDWATLLHAKGTGRVRFAAAFPVASRRCCRGVYG